MRPNRVGVRTCDGLRGILPAIHGDAVDVQAIGELLLRVADELAQISDLDRVQLGPRQDCRRELKDNLLDHRPFHADGAAFRADKSWQSSDRHASHAHEVADIVLDSAADKRALLTGGAADVRTFCSHGLPTRP